MEISVALMLRVKSSSVCTPTTLIVKLWMMPFLSSGGGGIQVTITDVAFMAIALTLPGDSFGSIHNNNECLSVVSIKNHLSLETSNSIVYIP